MENLVEKSLEPIEQMLDKLTVASVFGPATTEGYTTIVPVASLGYGFGYGFGEGQDEVKGSGGGGGAGGIASPRGYLHVTREGVTYYPINNDTLLGALGMVVAIWSILWTAITIITIAQVVGKKRE
jgi:uncharacterized spore protein YtfJ